MIYDAKVEVQCDECDDLVEIVLDYVYSDYSGENGHYDDSNIDDKLEKEYEWEVDGDNHYCPSCK